MRRKLDRAVRVAYLCEHGLLAGEVGTAVAVCEPGRRNAVELVTVIGETAALVALSASDVGTRAPADPARAREPTLAARD